MVWYQWHKLLVTEFNTLNIKNNISYLNNNISIRGSESCNTLSSHTSEIWKRFLENISFKQVKNQTWTSTEVSKAPSKSHWLLLYNNPSSFSFLERELPSVLPKGSLQLLRPSWSSAKWRWDNPAEGRWDNSAAYAGEAELC